MNDLNLLKILIPEGHLLANFYELNDVLIYILMQNIFSFLYYKQCTPVIIIKHTFN